MPSRRGSAFAAILVPGWAPAGAGYPALPADWRPCGEKASSELKLSAWELNRSRSMKLLSSRLWSLEVAVVTAHDLG